MVDRDRVVEDRRTGSSRRAMPRTTCRSIGRHEHGD